MLKEVEYFSNGSEIVYWDLQYNLNLDIMLLKLCNLFNGHEEFLQKVNYETRFGKSPISRQTSKQKLNNLLDTVCMCTVISIHFRGNF